MLFPVCGNKILFWLNVWDLWCNLARAMLTDVIERLETGYFYGNLLSDLLSMFVCMIVTLLFVCEGRVMMHKVTTLA